MQFLRSGEVHLHYRLEGPRAAPGLLLINSLGCDLRMWDAVVAALVDDYRLLRFDLRGHGLSDLTAGPYSMELLAADAAGLLDGLGLEPMAVCGISIGGLVAQQLALMRPLRGLVLCDTAQRIGTEAAWRERAASVRSAGVEPLVDAALQRWFTPGFADQALRAGFGNMLGRTPREGYAACCEALATADFSGDGGRMPPALVLVGAQDSATTPEMARALADALPEARLQIIDHAAHLPCVEQPKQFVRHLRAFLTGLG